ncbi:putative glycoside hydrolase [Bacillus sp. PS06]|nr:putative glycoside hydrolase [Bacillus sp. PS06]
MFIMMFTMFLAPYVGFANDNEREVGKHSVKVNDVSKRDLPIDLARFMFDSGLSFDYPEAVRGIYVTSHSITGPKFNQLMSLIEESDLNSMVIDIKDDHGNLTYTPEKESIYSTIGKNNIKNPRELLETLANKKIYPIARVVVFKDTVLAQKKPEWSFLDQGKVWKNNRGESFVNPFVKEVWDYNIGIAIEAAKLGFKEIQFDYVRFPEGFEKKDTMLKYQYGEYQQGNEKNSKKRVQAISEFVEYAKTKLEPYDVKVSVDIFGYSATLPEAPGIGQNFTKIAKNVDVISSMIYPSHWTSFFGIAKPDLEPYRLVSEYAKLENKRLNELDNRPISRPWIQDFTASWLGKGNYTVYGKEEVEAQIKALNENGIQEFLIWNASNDYTVGVDYTP